MHITPTIRSRVSLRCYVSEDSMQCRRYNNLEVTNQHSKMSELPTYVSYAGGQASHLCIDVSLQVPRRVLRGAMKVKKFAVSPSKRYLQATERGDLPRANTSRHSSDKGGKVFESLLAKDRFDDVIVDCVVRLQGRSSNPPLCCR